MVSESSPTISPRVLVIASDGPGGAHLARELASLGTTPAVTTEAEAVQAVRATEPNLVVWITPTVSPSKLDSLVTLVGRAALALVTGDSAARALLDRRVGQEIHLLTPYEPQARVSTRLAELARVAREAARRDSEAGVGLGDGRRPPQPTAPQIDVALDLDRAPTLGRPGGPSAVRPAPAPSPANRLPPLGPPPSAAPPGPPPSSGSPHRSQHPQARPPSEGPYPSSGGPRASPASTRPPPPSTRPPPPSTRPPPPSSRAPQAPSGSLPPRAGPGPAPWPARLSSAPEIRVAPWRPRRGRIALATAGALLLAGGAAVGAHQLGVLPIPPAVGALLARAAGPRGEPAPIPSTATAPPAPSGAPSAAGPTPSASASASATAPEAATGPDATFAEVVRPAPSLAKVLADRGPIPSLTGASVRQLVALAEDAHRREQAEDALHLAALALEKDPRSVPARALHLAVLLRAGDAPAVIAQADAYLQDTPSPVLAELRGDALAARGRFADARAAWIPDPTNRPAAAAVRSMALNGARARSQKGQSKEAKRFFRRAAVLDMTNLEAALALADLLLVDGDPKAAAAWAAHACELAPEVGVTHALLGRALVATEDSAGALAAFERAVKCNPSDRASVREVVRLRGAAPP